MRISDWSSDVCSSDLSADGRICSERDRLNRIGQIFDDQVERPWSLVRINREFCIDLPAIVDQAVLVVCTVAVVIGDRKSVVEGMSVSVRVDLGGRRIIKKK